MNAGDPAQFRQDTLHDFLLARFALAPVLQAGVGIELGDLPRTDDQQIGLEFGDLGEDVLDLDGVAAGVVEARALRRAAGHHHGAAVLGGRQLGLEQGKRPHAGPRHGERQAEHRDASPERHQQQRAGSPAAARPCAPSMVRANTFCRFAWRSSLEHIIGVSVRATKPDTMTAPARVSANSRNSRPVRPGVKATGA